MKRKGDQTGSKNAQWKGGRVVASNGYVLIKVGFGHHLADVRGYAYEHRIIAELKIGRLLCNGELVHHVNGNKQDNRPENLEVVSSNAEHYGLHRRADSQRRKYNEENAIVTCACGCGGRFARYDDNGRPRSYISGHNPPRASAQLALIAALSSGPKSVDQIRAVTSQSSTAVKVMVSKLAKRGLIHRVERGIYSKVV